MKKLFVLLALLPSFAFADLDHKKIDTELNLTYQYALNETIIKQQPTLIKAQRLWLNFRGEDCSAQVHTFGVSDYDKNMQNCISNHNLTRIEQLKQIIQRNKNL